MVFGKMNIQESNELGHLAKVEWGVQSLPNLVFIHDGKVLNRLTKVIPAPVPAPA